MVPRMITFTVLGLVCALPGNADEAVYPEAIKYLGPSDRVATLASTKLWRGEITEGSRLLWHAIEQNPDDIGKLYPRDRALHELTKEALAHGEKQVEQLVNDRGLQCHVRRGGPLWNWAARKFGGEDVGEMIWWDSTEPVSGFAADHTTVSPNTRGRIRVSTNYHVGEKVGQPQSFEGIWSCVIYELNNIVSSPKFYEVYLDGVNSKITREQYVTRYLALELRAVQRTRAYYAKEYLPWAEQHEVRTEPDHWFMQSCFWGTSEDFLKLYKDTYAWSYYGGYYDRLQSNARRRDEVREWYRDWRRPVQELWFKLLSIESDVQPSPFD